MTILVPTTLIGWVFVAVGLFTILPPRRAVLVAYLLGWLFLPQAGIDLPGVPDLDKINATSLGALAGVLLFDAGRLMRFRWHWVDIPILIWCIGSLPSALTNELPPDATPPLYDGISGVVRDTFVWGVPYLIGRMYFNDLQSLRELAIGIFLGGLIYVPLCLFELRMSPRLHLMFYGFHPSGFEMAVRYGGYRPMVFMQHGLMVGMWMTSASLVGAWLWSTGSLRRFWGVSMGWLVLLLIAVTIMCKSTGAILLLAVGLAVMFVNKRLQSTALLLVLVSITPLYMIVRAEGLWSGSQITEIAALFGPERADSVSGRLENEDMLTAKASEKPLFGWGGYGRWRVVDEYTGKDITVSDGMWVIALGEKGLVGLVSMTAVILLPFVLLLMRIKPPNWSHPWAAAPAVLALLLMLYSIDNLFNAMLNPVFLLGAGGLSGFYLAFPALREQALRERAAWLQNQANAVRPERSLVAHAD